MVVVVTTNWSISNKYCSGRFLVPGHRDHHDSMFMCQSSCHQAHATTKCASLIWQLRSQNGVFGQLVVEWSKIYHIFLILNQLYKVVYFACEKNKLKNLTTLPHLLRVVEAKPAIIYFWPYPGVATHLHKQKNFAGTIE